MNKYAAALIVLTIALMLEYFDASDVAWLALVVGAIGYELVGLLERLISELQGLRSDLPDAQKPIA